MIIEALFNLIFGLVNIILNILPNFPSLSDGDTSSLTSALDTIFNNASLLGFFFPIGLAKTLLSLVVIIFVATHGYKLAIWVVTWIKSHE